MGLWSFDLWSGVVPCWIDLEKLMVMSRQLFDGFEW